MACVLRTLFCFLVFAVPAAEAARAADSTQLQIITGDEAGTESALAADLAKLFAEAPALRVSPGDAGLGNLTLLITKPDIDVAFVSTDALIEAASRESGAGLPDRLEVVARLGPQEIHVLARRDIESLSGLAGQKVSVGADGGASALAATRLFAAFNVQVEPQALDDRAALEQLKRGKIAALVIVGGKPVPLLREIPDGLGLHLLPLPFVVPVQDNDLPTHFDHEDYPNLIRAEVSVPSLATGMVLLAASHKDAASARARVERFVEAMFSRFGELKRGGRHPKWREINLAASLPGWTRSPAAAAWLAKQSNDSGAVTAQLGGEGKPPIEASAAGPAALPMNDDQKEALFKGFLEWQRAKRH
jgi:TRAP-type uncharacterized transport system substrate-binding protein